MADIDQMHGPASAADTIDYKPLSGLAVAGAIVSCVYAALMVVAMVAAFVKGEPFFMGDWLIALPLAGAALSGAGLYHVANSEGTRAGTALARWGLGVSLVTGLGYFTYQTFTGLAIIQQANRFVLEKDENSGFLPRLCRQDGDPFEAVLFSPVPPSQPRRLTRTERELVTAFFFTLGDAIRGVRADMTNDVEKFDPPWQDNPKGPLSQFLEKPLVAVLGQAEPASIRMEALGVSSWVYENGAYHITRLYRITTDEAIYEVPIMVSSIEAGAEGEKRRWRVDNFSPLQLVSRTELGIQRQRLRQSALDFLNDPKTGWLTKLNKHSDAVDIWLALQKPQKRDGLRQRVAELQQVAALLKNPGPVIAAAGVGVAAGLAPEDRVLAHQLPGFRPMSKVADYFDMGNVRLRDPNPEKLKELKSAARLALSFPLSSSPSGLRAAANDMAPVEVRAGEVIITFQTQTVVHIQYPDKSSDSFLLLLKVVVGAAENLDPAAANANQQWYVKSVEFYRALLIPPKQP